MRFGAHMSTSGGVWTALQRAKSVHCEIAQIFVKNNKQWSARAFLAHEIQTWREELERHKLASVFGHAGYLINLASPPSPTRDNSLLSLQLEIELAASLGIPFLVLHPGAHLGAGEAGGLRQVVAALDQVFALTRTTKVKIALENTAGQGTCLGSRISHLAAVFDSVKRPERLGICLDTAHFFAAGYDIRTPKGWNSAIDEVEKLIGLEHILAFHLNDSKTELGSRVDRHEHIGDGKIGKAGFAHIVNDARFKEHPGCLETPKAKDLQEDMRNLATLRGLVKRFRSRAAPAPPHP